MPGDAQGYGDGVEQHGGGTGSDDRRVTGRSPADQRRTYGKLSDLSGRRSAWSRVREVTGTRGPGGAGGVREIRCQMRTAQTALACRQRSTCLREMRRMSGFTGAI
ncbi:hypothetical protein GCM10010221_42860 [Streptomyces parvus]|nr:hypothetical protein GCM10010221_42860 [Streptomyces parvus]